MSNTPEELSAQALILRGIEAIERVHARLEAIEKALDALNKEVGIAKDAGAKAESALNRIASTEEKRAAIEERAEAQRQTWIQRVWESQAFKILLIGFAAFLLKLLGVTFALDKVPSLMGGGP